MLRNQQPLFGSINDHHDDALTVQVSNANSTLGNYLLEADWEETSDHLSTPEGQIDVDAKNDPIGLFNSRKSTKVKHHQIPISKNTALFAALFVRAPYDVIETILALAPSHVDQTSDLIYALSIIPSEEVARSGELHKKVPYRTRAWQCDEYNRILDLLLRSFIASQADPSLLLDYWPSWVIGTSDVRLTPLAIAVYNPDIEERIVQLLCTLQPKAIDKECNFFGPGQLQTAPLIISAASPMPSKQAEEYPNAKNRRWEKVKLMTLSATWYDEQHGVLSNTGETDPMKIPLTDASPPPEPTVQQIEVACEEAAKRREWELVREFLKRYYLDEKAKGGESSVLEPIQVALAEHDKKAKVILERQSEARRTEGAREEWLHNNMGLVMYPVHVAMDLVNAVMPSSKKKPDEASRGLVSPMS